MPRQYEAIRDKLAKKMSYDDAQEHAARIYNAAHPGNPVTGSSEHSAAGARKKKSGKKSSKGSFNNRFKSKPSKRPKRRTNPSYGGY